MLDQQTLKPGTRVKIVADPVQVTLRSSTGAIVHADKYDDYFVIHLDEPAVYHAVDDHDEELTEIVEHIDNIDTVTVPVW